MSENTLSEEIARLKKERNAVILAHYYQIPDVQDVADHVGDSFQLSKLAAELPQDVIVFCGVRFMAETAKILSPEKTVLLPASDAGCPMADMVTEQDVLNLKKQHPEATVVSYVNSSTEVKALSDICCTSSNAIKVIKSLHQKKIIFVPDENLGSYCAQQIPEKQFVLFNGFCPVHEEVMAIDVKLARDQYPDALLVVHPECREDVRNEAAFIGSTGQIINYIDQTDHHTFIVGTESGIIHPLVQRNPRKRIVSLTLNFVCPNMKRTTLGHVLKSLREMDEEIELATEMMDAARVPLLRMLDATR